MKKSSIRRVSILTAMVLLVGGMALAFLPKSQLEVTGEFPEGELKQIQRFVDQHEARENRHRIAWGMQNPRSLPHILRWAASERILRINRESNGVMVLVGTSQEVLNSYWFSYTNTEWKSD